MDLPKVKDLFSSHAPLYAAYRPEYPESLYSFLFGHVRRFQSAWDCATGNGQVARILAAHFVDVQATDISDRQLKHAHPAPNTSYSVARAEQTPFADHSFDLITVAQAIHWFDLDAFYGEVRRVAGSGCILAAWSYKLFHATPAIDAVISDFYSTIVGPYWDSARALVDAGYATIPFPFDEIKAPVFHLPLEWTRAHCGGYLSSWSATQNFIRAKGYDPVPACMAALDHAWPENEVRTVTFDLSMRIGRVTP